MTSRKPYLWATLVWIILVIAFFSPVIFQGKVIAPLDIMESLLRPWASSSKIEVHNAFTYDAISQYLPYDWSVYQSLRQDGYIGWNPYTHSGTSIVENTMICPGDWHHHLYRFLPFWTAWNAGIIIQFFIAGLGTLLVLRNQKIPAAHALIGIVAFGFYSQFILWIQHRWILGAMCWVPWILWSLLRARKADRMIDIPSIFFIALAFRGGHLQTCVFTVLVVVLIALHEWWYLPQRWNVKNTTRLLLPYASTGVFACLLSIDVFIETIPPFLAGGRELPGRSWFDTLLALPTLATSFIPTILGTPQGLDASKAFKIDLFSIKYAGALTLFLAAIAAFKRQAPSLAKIFLLVGLFLPFTPADKWLYSRVTVIFALGIAWLASWQVNQYAREPRSKIWKYAAIAFAVTIGCWFIASAGMTWKSELIQTKLREMTMANLDDRKPMRTEWMLARAQIFYTESLIWHPRNLAFLSLIFLGGLAAAQIHINNKKSHLFAIALACITFTEILIFSKTWITFSPKPSSNEVFNTPSWLSDLKKQVGIGRIKVESRADFDYMQLNTPSAYGLRFSEGYETVTPSRINPDLGWDWDPAPYAKAGVSHLLAAKNISKGSINGWMKVHESPDYVLYSNPLFKGLNSVTLASGESVNVTPYQETPNRKSFELPCLSQSIDILESYNRGWKYSLDKLQWLPVTPNQDNSIHIKLPDTTNLQRTLHLQYTPEYQSTYRFIILFTMASLLIIQLMQWKRTWITNSQTA